MNDKKVLITGGAGFIGSHTAIALQEAGYIPVIVDNFVNSEENVLKRIEQICGRKIHCYKGDCTDSQFLTDVFKREERIIAVIHFAAYKSVHESNKFPVRYYMNNLGSLFNLLDVMIQNNVMRMVFSSSCTVYGSPDSIPVTEDMPIKETPSTYGKTKQFSEQVIEDIVHRHSLFRAVLLRYFNPIGAHPSGLIGELPIGVPNNLVPFMTQTAAGLRDKLTVFGSDYDTPDGTCVRDYIHVLDLAKAHILAFEYIMKSPQRRLEKYNIGTGKGVSVLELIKTFEQVNGIKLRHVVGERRDGDVGSIYADATKALKELGWKAQRTIQDALYDAWRWQQQIQPANQK